MAQVQQIYARLFTHIDVATSLLLARQPFQAGYNMSSKNQTQNMVHSQRVIHPKSAAHIPGKIHCPNKKQIQSMIQSQNMTYNHSMTHN